LLDKGARQQEIIKHFYKTKPFPMLKLWGNTLSKLQFDPTYKISWSSITQKDLELTSATLDQGDGIVDELMTNIPGTLLALLCKEKEHGLISGSLRSTTDDVNVSRIAKIFDGGGHVRAAGFRYKYTGAFSEAEKEILKLVREDLAKQLSISQDDQKQAEAKVQKLSIDINGKHYDFSEEEIKEMALKFLISQKQDIEPEIEKTKKVSKSEKKEKELKKDEEVDLKKYYQFE
jgi:hypothetical protein